MHLLWALLFLKRYDTEHTNHSITGADEKTFRKWVWIFVDMLAYMDAVGLFAIVSSADSKYSRILLFQIVWENRFIDAGDGQECYVSFGSH